MTLGYSHAKGRQGQASVKAMSSANAFPYTVNPIKPKHDQYLLRGRLINQAGWRLNPGM